MPRRVAERTVVRLAREYVRLFPGEAAEELEAAEPGAAAELIAGLEPPIAAAALQPLPPAVQSDILAALPADPFRAIALRLDRKTLDRLLEAAEPDRRLDFEAALSPGEPASGDT